MKRLYILLCTALALCLCSCGGPKLKCNFSSADISALENEHLALAGFAARQGLSDGIHIPLKTNC
ncbi:MAG: hypothetical protein IKX03_02400, partial [Bacteroidales bacterium]|nr:hypothetical protein [Bacteroidales bacterium]